MRRVFFAAALLSVTAFGAIVENINSLGVTFYYFVDGSEVTIRECDALPTSEMDPGRCRAVSSRLFKFDPMDLDEFEAGAKAWGLSELVKTYGSIAGARKQLARERKRLAEIDAILAGLSEHSPAIRDYRDRREEVARRIAELEPAVSAAKGQDEGFDLLFGRNGYLRQDLLHPIAEGQSSYRTVRPWVRHLFDVFKYRGQDPIKPLSDARAEFARFKSEGLRPYCAFWSGGFRFASEIDSSSEGIIRTLVSLDKSESFRAARESCKELGMDLPVAAHIPGYHSHLWSGGSEQETWPVEKSARIFAETELAQGLPGFDYLGRKLKIFWVQIGWTSRFHRPGEPDAFFTSPSGDWFRFNDGQDEGGVGVKATALPADPSWELSVVCEKQYPTLPRYIEPEELPECQKYVGWP